MIIDITYFFDEFNIAQKSTATVIDKIGRYIVNYEREYIEKAIGKDFAALFNGSSDPIFGDLEDMLKAKPSPIAAYVFFHYQRDNVVLQGSAGDSIGKVENGNRISEGYRMVTAWNIMVDETREVRQYIIDNKTIFPTFDVYQCDFFLNKKLSNFGI